MTDPGATDPGRWRDAIPDPESGPPVPLPAGLEPGGPEEGGAPDAPPWTPPSRTAVALSAVLPGAGQLRTGRPAAGLLALLLWIGLLGLLWTGGERALGEGASLDEHVALATAVVLLVALWVAAL